MTNSHFYTTEGEMPFTTLEQAKVVLGGKGAGLWEMQKLGIPVPEFVVIPTSLCVEYMKTPDAVRQKVKVIAAAAVDYFTEKLGFLPLLSVRSGARVSCPGMMDTILNVGMGDPLTNKYTAKLSERTVADCQRRFLHMFGTTVCGLDNDQFEALIADARKKANVDTDAELSAKALHAVATGYQAFFDSFGPKSLTLVAQEQIERCILAVMDSWNSERAVAYREEYGIPHEWGTAVVIQRMVFGNMNDNSSSGVAFSRDPATGQDSLIGEFLPNAQGEDVVAGIRTPKPISEMPSDLQTDLAVIATNLELHFRDMLDMEFTVEDGKLYMLQVRTAKRSARAAVRCALDMHNGGIIYAEEVMGRITREQVKLLTRPVIDPSFDTPPHLTGIPGCAGVATGKAAFTVEQALAYKEAGVPCILIRHETTPDDIKGMFASVGILTATGGHTSHAAVVARGMDKVCVTGAEKLQVLDGKANIVEGPLFDSDSKVTLDGTTGRVWVDIDVPVSDPTDDTDVAELMAFIDADQKFVDVALPDSPGTVYFSSQFLGEVPAPLGKEVVIIEDVADSNDPLLGLCGKDDLGTVIGHRMVAWVEQHNVKARLFSPNAKEIEEIGNITFTPVGKGLDALLARPTTISEVETFFGGTLGAVQKLIAPAKLEEKFQIIGCQRYRLLAAFS